MANPEANLVANRQPKQAPAHRPSRTCRIGSNLVAAMKTVFALAILSMAAYAAEIIKTANGILEGTVNPATGIRMFKGVPFAQPPVGDLRWREPQPLKDWTGVRKADRFGARCAQRPVFGDMNFRSNGMGEDCLYLNIWTPAKSGNANLPVLVYFYGGGFVAGDGSEPPTRYLWVLFSSRTHERIAASCFGQLRTARPARRPALGKAEHRYIRRRSE